MSEKTLSMRLLTWRKAILQSDLEPPTRHLLLTLSCYMNEMGESCFPSIATLMDNTGLARATVIKHLKVARQSGWLTVEQHGYRGQRWKRNEYVASIPSKVVQQVNRLKEKGGSAGEPRNAEGGSPSRPKVVQEVNSNSSIELSKKKKKDMSGFQPDAPPAGHEFNGNPIPWEADTQVNQARRIITYLNKQTGRRYQAASPSGTLTAGGKMIVARIKDGYTKADFAKVIRDKVERWKGDDKMDEYLRPTTLFCAKHFADYLGGAKE